MTAIAIVGTRTLKSPEVQSLVFQIVKKLKSHFKDDLTIISGGAQHEDPSARNPDIFARIASLDLGVTFREYPAEWERYASMAGPIRNDIMAKQSNYVIAIWNHRSRGTQDMLQRAEHYGLPFMIFNDRLKLSRVTPFWPEIPGLTDLSLGSTIDSG